MGIFNYPPDPEPVQLAYYRDRKAKAREIDPGIKLAEENSARKADHRNHPSSGLRGSNQTSRSRTHRVEEGHAGSPDDSFISWLFTERGR
jgi:hypothetical protein